MQKYNQKYRREWSKRVHAPVPNQDRADKAAKPDAGVGTGEMKLEPKEAEKKNDPRAIRLIVAMALFPIVLLIVAVSMRVCG